MSAVDSLLALHTAGEDWEAVIETLQSKASLLEEPLEQAAILKEAGAIASEQFEKPELAIEIFENIRGLVPEDESVLDALESLLARTEDWEALVEHLSMRIERESSLDGKKAIAYQKAGIFENEMDSIEQAIETYQMVLSWDESDSTALRQLDTLFTKQEDWLDLLQTLERLRGLVSADEARDLLVRIGQLWESELDSTTDAIASYATLLEEDPTDERGVTALEAIVVQKDEREDAFRVLVPVLEVCESWERLFNLHEVLVSLREDPTEKVQLFNRMGELAESHLGNPNQAFMCFSRALEQTPRDTGISGNLERLAEAHTLWEDLAELYLEVAPATDDDRALELELRVGQLLTQELGDAHRAVSHYERLLKDHEDNGEVLQALDELYQLTDNPSGLAGILRTKVDICPELEDRVALYFRLAETLEDALEDQSGAFECYQEVVFQQDTNEEAISELWRLTESGVRRAEGVEILEPIYSRGERHLDLRNLLEVSLADLSDPADQGDQLRRIAELCEGPLEDQGAAMTWYGKALQLDPEDEQSLGRLDELAAENGSWQTYTDALLEAAEAAEAERKITLWLKSASATWTHLENKEDTELLFLQVLSVDEEQTDALAGLDELYTGDARWGELEPVLGRRVAVAEYDDEQVRLLTRLAHLYRSELDQVDQAIGALRKITELEETNLDALQQLADLYRQTENAQELFGVLEQLTMALPGEKDRCAAFEEMAGIAEHLLERPEDAMGLWEEVLMLAPEHLDALRELQRLREGAGKWEELAESIERELRVLGEEDPDRRATQHRKLGVLWRDTLEEPLQSQRHWEQVLSLVPGDREALDSLRDVYREGGAAEAQAGILEQLVALENEAADGLEMWVELATLRQTVLGQPEGAIAAWNEVLDRDAGNGEALSNWNCSTRNPETGTARLPFSSARSLCVMQGVTLLVHSNSWYRSRKPSRFRSATKRLLLQHGQPFWTGLQTTSKPPTSTRDCVRSERPGKN